MTKKAESKRKRVLITGASDGIGFRLLKLFCAEGADVIGTGSRSVDALPSDWPKKARYLKADQSKLRVANKISKYLGQEGWSWLDHLVLNAGVGRVGSPEDESIKNLEETLSVNLIAPVLITHALYPELENNLPGKVTLIGSGASSGNWNFASYAAAKGGLAGFARALASEWQGKIDVQMIDPAPIDTGMHEKAGLETRWFHRFFINPDYAAERIHQLINGDKPMAKVGYLDRGLARLRALGVPEKQL